MKPMLAGTVKDLKDVQYPCYVTPKIDGIRCLIQNGKPVSRSLKPIRNKYIQSTLKGLPDGLDGELTLRYKSNFNEVSSAIMSEDGKPDFVYLVFDIIGSKGYLDRIKLLEHLKLPYPCQVLVPDEITCERDLLEYERAALTNGFEGVMLRAGDGGYKFGRSTVRQGWLLKLKRFVDSECEILGFVEQLKNENVARKNALGRTERSRHKDNLKPKGVLGALEVRDLKTGVEFSLGTGFDDDLRKEIWQNPEKYENRIIKYKYQPTGVKEKPRHPVFLGFRDREDM